MSIAGNHLKDPNFRLRILLIIFIGLAMSTVILYWRTQYLVSQEYIEFPVGTSISAANKTNKEEVKKPTHVRKDLQGYEDLYQ